MPFWADAALLAAAGVETVMIGPSGAGAHAAEEWVELQSLVDLAQILAETAVEYCG
jgi:acetylornithine deacetylase